MLHILAFLVTLGQTPDPTLTNMQSAIQQAVADGDLQAIVLSIPGGNTSGRHTVCLLAGTSTSIHCSRYTIAWSNIEQTVGEAMHTTPTEYDINNTSLRDIIAAERAWVNGS